MNDFVQAILAEPESDAPRLVYADHLSELGDPRGELISLQIARNGSDAARQRVAELIDTCWDDISGFVREAGVQRFCVRRGFVEAVSIQDKHVSDLPGIMAQAPVLDLEITGTRDGVAELGKMRELLSIRALRLGGLGLGNKRCLDLLRSGYLANVSILDLSANGIGDPVALALARSAANLPCLEHLDLAMNRFGADALDTLTKSPLAEQLLALRLDASTHPEAVDDGADGYDGVWFP